MEALPRRQLGRTGLDVTVLGYGAMELRGLPGGRDVSDEQAERILNAVLDGGINYIDTSIDYGLSEERIGKFISQRRSEYFLASKCGCWAGEGTPPPTEGGRNPHVFTPENIIAGVEQSLRRMRTDYLDVVQFHGGSPPRELLERHGSLRALEDLQRQGKVRFIGMSGTLPNLHGHMAMGVFDVFQIPYSALEREHEEVVSQASAAGAGIVIRGGAAKGGPGKHQGGAWDSWQRAGLDELLDGMSVQDFVLRFTLSHPDMDTTIVGTVNPQHLEDNLRAAARGPLPADVYAEAKRRLSVAISTG